MMTSTPLGGTICLKWMLKPLSLIHILPASSRRYPWVAFKPDREIGRETLEVADLSKTVDGVKVLNHVSFRLNREDKVAFLCENDQAATALFQILTEETEPDGGSFKWGLSTSVSYTHLMLFRCVFPR